MSIREEIVQAIDRIDTARLALLTQFAILFDEEAYNTKTITNTDSPYTILITDHTLLVDSASGNVTIVLPFAADLPGECFWFKKVATANVVTINTQSGDSLEGTPGGGSTKGAGLKGAIIQNDGVLDWWIIAEQ